MVERPADVFSMDRQRPVRLDWAWRLDAACRRMPGLGIFIMVALLEHWWSRGELVIVGLLAIFALRSILDEFLPKLPEKKPVI